MDASGRRGDRGAAAVEFALVSLLLITVLLGTIAFGFGLYKQQSALHAAREGSRLAAVGVNDCAAFSDEVVERGQGANIGTVTMTINDANGNGNGPGDEVAVSVTYQIDLSYLGFLGFSTINGTQTGKSRVEQVGSELACP